jgi:hypothetical protein
MKRIKLKLGVLFCGLVLLNIACKPAQQLPDPLVAGWNGKTVCKEVEDNKKIRIIKCTFPPNVGHEKHIHAPHIGYTLNGGTFKITDATGSREVSIPTGYTFKNDSIVIHEVLNIGKTTADFLIIEYK